MSDGTTAEEATTTTDSQPTEGAGSGTDGKVVPLAALTKEREKYQGQVSELQQQLQALRDAEAERERKRAEDQGEWQKLYEEAVRERDTLKDKATGYDQMVRETTARVQARIDALPETFRALIPDGLDLSALTLQVDRIEALAKQSNAQTGEQPRDTGGRTGTGGGHSEGLTAEQREWATKKGIPSYVSPSNIKKLYRKEHSAAGAKD